MYLPKKLFLLTTLVIAPFLTLLPQETSKRDLAKAVHEADISYYYDEDYVKAASLYESLVKEYPDNENFAAKLGICCLNIDGKRKEALELLKIASGNVVENEKDYLEYGDKSPLDTWLYLAVAYQRNDSLLKAQEAVGVGGVGPPVLLVRIGDTGAVVVILPLRNTARDATVQIITHHSITLAFIFTPL